MTETHNRIIVIGKYRIEVQAKDAVQGIFYNNYWAQVISHEGIIARFGKPVPAVRNADSARDTAIMDATHYIELLIKEGK